MKQPEKKSLASLSAQELSQRIAKLEEEIKSWYLKKSSSQIKNGREGKMLRQKLAVIKTFWRQKQLSS